MRLSWALVHSRHPEDVQCGIAMLLWLMQDPTATEREIVSFGCRGIIEAGITQGAGSLWNEVWR